MITVDGLPYSQNIGSSFFPCTTWGGEWCGPLVPVEEVKNAYREGFDNGFLEEGHSYLDSRARRVVEGEIQ